MTTHIVGIVPPDETWKRMKAVWDSCTIAKVEIPKAVLEFFNHVAPDDKGVLIPLDKHSSITEYYNETARQGYEVWLEYLPVDIKVLRFYNSW